MVSKRIGAFIAFYILVDGFLLSQEYHGITGLIQTPCAETDSAGTFRGNVSWVDKSMLPNMGNYGDGIPFSAPCYTFGVTLWTWLQVSYTGTLLKMHPNRDNTRALGFYNEDRHINVKLRPLKEGKWWPSIAVGCDDVGRFNVKWNESSIINNYFQNLYLVASKHIEISDNELGFHLAYRYYTSYRNAERRGLSGGISFMPAFFKPLRGIVEWDGIGVNAGVDVLLWRRLLAQVALIHGRGFSGSIGYHYQIPF